MAAIATLRRPRPLIHSDTHERESVLSISAAQEVPPVLGHHVPAPVSEIL
jgi:hypothetical protein